MSGTTTPKSREGEPEHIPAARFKAECLALMDRVQQDRNPVVITKRGKPVAKLVPYEAEGQEAQTGWGWTRGMLIEYGDIVSPVDVKWEANAD